MKSNFKYNGCINFFFAILFIVSCKSQKDIVLKNESITKVNRQVSINGNTLNVNASEGDGLAILEDVSFKVGTLQFDVKGENDPGKSFVGIAFNIQNDSTYESIYFRPFNFESPEKVRREHGIQYIYEPKFPWRRLRQEQEGVFEAEFIDPPSPDDWFSITLKVEKDKVTVMESGSNRTLLEVERLSSTSSGKIGFWVGNNSKGSFRNLRIE